MVIARVTKVANGKRAIKKRSVSKPKPRHKSAVKSSNPAHLLTLNPSSKRRSTVKKAHKKSSARKTSVIKRPAHTKMMKKSKGNHRKHSPNPQFFGSHITPVRLGEYVLAGLVGVTVNRAIVAALPATITSNNLYATLAALAIAVGQWWLGSMASKDLGSAFGFGGLMNASSQALNAFIPSVGSVVSLSGRGTGDFVPATFTIPPQPAGIGHLSSYVN
jgi:hypothetical protein